MKRRITFVAASALLTTLSIQACATNSLPREIECAKPQISPCNVPMVPPLETTNDLVAFTITLLSELTQCAAKVEAVRD